MAEKEDLRLKEDEQRKKTFNNLTAKEWASLSKNVWNDVSSPREKRHTEHGATYPKKLSGRIIQMYSGEGDLILDPFLGVGSTLESCREQGRKGIGIELNQRFVELAKEVLSQKTLNKEDNEIKIIQDDCRNLLRHINKNSVQLMVTSPPYANFIHKSVEDRKNTHKKSLIKYANKSAIKPYSEDKKDFGNLEYEEFLNEMGLLMKKLYKVTKSGGYNIWIVKDYRDTKNKIPYIDFHTDIAKLGESIGFKYHDLIVWDQTSQRKLVLLGYPSIFYTNQNCSFLVVLRKPNGI